jgi:hypothetical protein|tara:strand:- start:1162 stop:1476 length:315 start_codon:yes stop_codon:yes gene_type:complete
MKYDELTNRQRIYVDAVIEHGPDLGLDLNKDDFTRAELRMVSMKTKGKKWIPNWITHDQSRRSGRGVFSIPEIREAITDSPEDTMDVDTIAVGIITEEQEVATV